MPLIMGKLVLESGVLFLLEHTDSLAQSLALDYVAVVFKDGVRNAYIPSTVKRE